MKDFYKFNQCLACGCTQQLREHTSFLLAAAPFIQEALLKILRGATSRCLTVQGPQSNGILPHRVAPKVTNSVIACHRPAEFRALWQQASLQGPRFNHESGNDYLIHNQGRQPCFLLRTYISQLHTYSPYSIRFTASWNLFTYCQAGTLYRAWGKTEMILYIISNVSRALQLPPCLACLGSLFRDRLRRASRRAAGGSTGPPRRRPAPCGS